MEGTMGANDYVKSLVKRAIDAFVEESRNYGRPHSSQADIARRMWPDDSSAPQHLNAMLSTAISGRTLDATVISMALDACREMLTEKYRLRGEASPVKMAEQFEREVCARFRLSASGRIVVNDFECDRRFADSRSLADFGLPDMLSWRDADFASIGDFGAVQEASLSTLGDLRAELERCTTTAARTNLLQLAINVAHFHYPGSTSHAEAMDIATRIADLASLHSLCDSKTTDAELRDNAFQLKIHLKWARFFPFLDAPSNYVSYILRGEAMPPDDWRWIGPHVDETIAIAAQRINLGQRPRQAMHSWIAALSLKSRFLSAVGTAEALREAASLERICRTQSERFAFSYVPYGFLPTILHQVRGTSKRLKSAIDQAAYAAEQLDATGDHAAGAAFAALQLQLIHRASGSLSADKTIVERARTALRSPVIRFKHSHVFDVPELDRLLRVTANENDRSANAGDNHRIRSKRRTKGQSH
jgi:hypothetical protein